MAKALMHALSVLCGVLAGMNLGLLYPQDDHDAAWWKVTVACTMAIVFSLAAAAIAVEDEQ